MSTQKNLAAVKHDADVIDSGFAAPVLVIGAVVGALTGLGAAYLLIQRAKKRGESPNLTAVEGIKLGLLVFGLLRQVSVLGSGEEK